MKKLISLFITAILVCGGLTKVLQPTRDAQRESAEERLKEERVASQVDKTLQRNAECRQETTSTAIPESMLLPSYETSRGAQVIKHIGYTTAYDADYKTPQWVAWSITSEQAQGTIKRSDNFAPDPDVRGAKAYPSDYTNSGYDRGHMAPAADMKWSKKAMDESFYMTNMCPQTKNLNRGDWKALEELERQWAVSQGCVSIAAGPIYKASRPKRIGANKVAVPDAFFKVILVDYPKAPKAYAFVFENKAGHRDLSSYQLSVNELEERTGMDFFPGLSERVEGLKPELIR